MPKTYKTSESFREKARKQWREKRGKHIRANVLMSDSLRSAHLSSVEVDWAVRLILALRERHP